MLRILLLVVVCVFVHAEHEPERVRGPVTVSPIAGMIRDPLIPLAGCGRRRLRCLG